MKGKIKLSTLAATVIVLSQLLAACATPTPVVEIQEATVIVQETVMVTEMEEVVITATPEPAPDSLALAEALERGYFYVANIQEHGFAYINENGEFTGLDADIARYVANELGVADIVSVHLAWDGLIPSLLAGHTDLIAAGMAAKPARCEVVAFSNIYHILGPTALVEKGNPFASASMEDIAAQPEFIVGGMSGSLDVDVLREFGVPEEQIRSYDEISLAFEDLKAGRLNGVIGTAPSHQLWLEGADMGDKFEIVSPWASPAGYSYPSALVFRQEDQALVDMASEIIEQMKADGTLVELAIKNGFPPEIIAPLCSESDLGCVEYHCPDSE